jgi:type IV secretory pathway VirB4 component
MIKNRNETMGMELDNVRIQEFLDMIAPSVVKFNTDHFICGNTYRCVWALREYPTATEEQAILRHLGEKDGITLRIYTRHVTPVEEKKIISNAANKNRMNQSNTNDLQQTVMAESNLQDVATIVAQMHRNREPLLHVAVYLELSAYDLDQLKLLQTEVLTELIRSKLNVDRLMLRQQQGFQCVMPSGYNVFRDQFERVLPASSVANLYPFNYSGKTDGNGFYVGRDKFGSNVLVDFNKRADDKTNANILILGNSGQGKSYLLKLILCNLRESGMNVCALDPEMEYEDLTNNLGGCFIDLMSGEYIINVLEPKTWDENGSPNDPDAPQTFRISSKLSQHISFLKDFFRTYKDFSDIEIDTIEIMLQKLYSKFGITDTSNFDRLKATDYPILSDLYALIEEEYKSYDDSHRQLYTIELLQNILLGLHSICKGAESKFFDGHTNITDSSFITFGVKGLLQASKSLKNALLFNILSFMSNELLTHGNTVASIDEFYLFLTNLTAVEYVRNFSKRVRKKDSAVIIASQNLEDFNIEGIREYTKPLFSIPTHQFLFNAGNIDAKFYSDTLQLEQSEYNLIRYPQRGVCLYKCGNERYNLMVNAPEYKAKLFGKAGGR